MMHMQSSAYLTLHRITSVSYCDIQNNKGTELFLKTKHILTKPVFPFVFKCKEETELGFSCCFLKEI